MYRFVSLSSLVLLISVTFTPCSFADEIEIAKVYRDYPGYLETPTCNNPRFSDNHEHTDTATPQNWACSTPWTLTPMVGYHLIDGGLELDDNVSIGLAVGYDLTSNWSIEVGLRYTPTETSLQPGNNLDVDIWMLIGGVNYNFQPEKRLNPYLAAGVGGIVYDIDGTNHNDEDFIGYWGGGFNYTISQNTALRVDVRHILDYRSDNTFDDADLQHQLSTMVGLTFRFGG